LQEKDLQQFHKPSKKSNSASGQLGLRKQNAIIAKMAMLGTVTWAENEKKTGMGLQFTAIGVNI